MNVPADEAASLNSHPGEDSSQASETSDTSGASSLGLRPVPRKRTFLSRQPLNSDPESDAPAGPAYVVPAPRLRRQGLQEDTDSPQQPLSDDQAVFSANKYGGTASLKEDRSVEVLKTAAKALATLQLKDRDLSGQTQRSGVALT